MGQLKRVSVFCTLCEGIVISADIQSRTRTDLTHYSRVIINPANLKITKESCSCEAYTFCRKCWHIKLLEQLIENNKDLREEIERAKEEFETDFLPTPRRGEALRPL